MSDLKNIGIRKIGILVCFQTYKAEFKDYPKNPEELHKVTGSLLPKSSFKKYQKWFFEYIGEVK